MTEPGPKTSPEPTEARLELRAALERVKWRISRLMDMLLADSPKKTERMHLSRAALADAERHERELLRQLRTLDHAERYGREP